MDDSQPLAEALAVSGGRIIAVGENSEIRELAGLDTEELDVGGRTVVPAFTDGHIHLVDYGLSLGLVQLDNVPSLAEAVALVAQRAQTAEPGEWIFGHGWNHHLHARPARRSP